MRVKNAGIAVLLIALMALAYWYADGNLFNEDAASDDNTKFALVEAADRSFDGAPALALTFSLPVSPGISYDKYIQVFEMPPSGDIGQHRRSGDEEQEDDVDGEPPATKGATTVVSTRPEDTDT